MKVIVVGLFIILAMLLSGCFATLKVTAPDGTKISYTAFGNRELKDIQAKTPAWSASMGSSVAGMDEAAIISGILEGLK